MARPRWRLHLPSPQIRHSSRRARVPRPRKRKSAKAVTGDVLARLIATCSNDSLRDVRAFRLETNTSPPSNALLQAISATDGRQSAFHVSDARICAAHLLPALSGLHLGNKTRLQLYVFSRIHYLYTATVKRARKPWQNVTRPIHRRRPGGL